MKKMRHRKGEWFAQSRTLIKLQILHLNPSNLVSEPEDLSFTLDCERVTLFAKSQCLLYKGDICHSDSLPLRWECFFFAVSYY